MAESVVSLIFKGVDQTGEATTAALNNVQKFSKGLQNVTGPVSDFTTDAIKLEAALLTAGAALVGFSIKVAGDFDTAFREISTLLDKPIEDLGEFRQSIIDYAKDSTQSLNTIGNAVYTAISNGIEYTEVISFMTEAEKLAVAGKADLNDVTTVLTKTLGAYGKDVADVGNISDVFFSTVQNGALNISELSNAFPKVSGPAASLGVSIEEVTALLATLTTTTAPNVDIAASQLAQAFFAILAPTEQAKQVAAELGIEFNAAAVQSRGFESVLQDVVTATDGNEEALKRLFGSTQAVAAILPIAGNAAGLFASNLEDARNAAGLVEEAFNKMIGGFEFQNRRIINALQGVALEIGGPLLESYGGVANAIAAVFNAVGANVAQGQLGGLVQYLDSVFKDTEAIFRNIARNLPEALQQADLSGFIRNIEAVRDGISQALGGLDLGSVDGLAAAITLIADSFGTLGTFVGGAIEQFRFVIDAAVKVAGAINSTDDSILKFAGSLGGISIILDKVLPAFDTLLLLLIAARGGGLVAGAATAAKSLGTLAVGLGKFAGPVGVAGAAGYGLGTLLANGIDAVVDRTTGSASLGSLIYDLIHGTEDWTAATTIAAKSQGDLASETGKASDTAKEVVKDYDAIVDNAFLASDSNDALAASFAAVGLSFDPVSGAITKLNSEVAEVAETTDEAEQLTRRWVQTMVNGVPTFTQVGSASKKAFDEAGKSAEEAEKKSESYLLKMQEIASDERIANIEAKVSLDIAQLEADTARALAAFDSINTTINSTGDLLGTLFGEMSNVNRYDQNRLINQIELENERRQEALDLQKRLVEAEIRTLDARADMLERGDSLITINGEGLQPHLEAFMWEILRTIQTRVNEDGLEMLLGTT